jgi:hypothetical protein
MDWITKCRQDVCGLMAKVVAAADEHDVRELTWKTAALPSPAHVEGADATASPMHAYRIGKWRAELLKKLRRLEAIEKVKGALPDAHGRRQEQELLEAECDELSQLILDEEELAPSPLLPSSKDPRAPRLGQEEAQRMSLRYLDRDRSDAPAGARGRNRTGPPGATIRSADPGVAAVRPS